MRSFIQSFAFVLVGLSLVVMTGCKDASSDAVSQADASSDGDHDHDHGDHDHGDHDHGDHDHGDHDHGDHDHGDHDHGDGDHDHPESLDDAIVELVSMYETIAEGFASDDTDVAHGPLHDVGHVLEDAEALVKKADVDDETKKKLEEAIATLFEAYGDVDGKLHGKPTGKDYSEVADQIDAAIKTLKAQANGAEADDAQADDPQTDDTEE